MSPQSRTRRSLRNVVWAVLTQGILMILGFVVRTALVFSLGLEYVGLDSALMSLIALLTIAEAGMGASVMYSMYAPLKQGDEERLLALVLFARGMFRWITLILVCIGGSLVLFLEGLVGGDIANDPFLEVYYLVLLAGLCSKYLFMHRSLLVIADQRFYLTKWYNFVVQATRSCLQIVLLLVWEEYLAFVVVSALGSFAYGLLLHSRTAAHYPFLEKRGQSIEREERRSLYVNVRAMFYNRAAVRVLSNATPLVVVGMLGATVGGKYANYLLILTSCLVLFDLTFQAMTASFGSLVASGNAARVRDVFDEVVLVTKVLYGTTAVMFAFSLEEIIRFWVGAEATLGPAANILIVLNYLAYGQMAPITVMREATGLFRRVRWVLPTAAFLSVLLSIGLGSWLGLLGVLAGPVLARLLFANWVEPYLLFRRSIGGRYVRYVARQFAFYSLVLTTFLGLGFLARVQSFHWLSSPIPSILVSAVVAFGLIATGLGMSSEGRRLKSRLRGLIIR